MVNNIEHIQELQKMIVDAQELLQDEMARVFLGDKGIEAVKYMINHYKEQIQSLKNEINILIDTNQAKIDPQCLQEIIDLIVINPNKAEIEQILEDYGIIYHCSN